MNQTQIKHLNKMRKRPDMKTTKKQIVDWCSNITNIDECSYPVDGSEMDTHCFRCAYPRETERAHIVPWAVLDYDPKYDSPKYYRLLCSECHAEAPNVVDENAMDKWIRETAKISEGMYEVYWDYREKLEELFDQTGTHGFELRNKSTLKWITEEFFKWRLEREERLYNEYISFR